MDLSHCAKLVTRYPRAFVDLEPLHPIQLRRFREMTPNEKWSVFRGMQRTAREVRSAAVRRLHPDWDDACVAREIAKEFARGRT